MCCTVCRLACPQQILPWFMQWNWLKWEPWSSSLSTFLSPTPLVPLLSVPNICSGKIPAKVPLWTSIFWYQVMLHQSSYIMSLQTYKMLLPPWHNLTRCHNTSSQKHYYCCYFFSLPLHPQWYPWRATEKYYWVSTTSRHRRACLPRKLFAHKRGAEAQVRSYRTAGAILVSHWGWHTPIRPHAERVGSCLWGHGHGPASQVAFRDAKARGTYLQGSKCPPCYAPGLLGGVILKSCLLCAVITMNTPTAARDLKRRKPLKEKPYMAKPLKSRGELESSHNAGIFRW